MALILFATFSLILLSVECQIVDPLQDGCADHISGGLTCSEFPNFCRLPEAHVICQKFCGLCGLGCNFEARNLCSWTSEVKPLFLNWAIDTAQHGHLLGGPMADHTTDTGDGHYILTNGTGAVVPEATLVSPTQEKNSQHCLQFSYYFASSASGQLSIQRQVLGTRTEILHVTRASDVTPHQWHDVKVSVAPYQAEYSILIAADTGGAAGGPIAIDDITMTSESCVHQSGATTTSNPGATATTKVPVATTSSVPTIHAVSPIWHNWEDGLTLLQCSTTAAANITWSRLEHDFNHSSSVYTNTGRGVLSINPTLHSVEETGIYECHARGVQASVMPRFVIYKLFPGVLACYETFNLGSHPSPGVVYRALCPGSCIADQPISTSLRQTDSICESAHDRRVIPAAGGYVTWIYYKENSLVAFIQEANGVVNLVT